MPSDDDPPRRGTDGKPDPTRHEPETRFDEVRLDIEERIDAARHDIEERLDAARAQFEETNERIRKRTGRDLIPAILVGLLLGGILLLSLFWIKWLFIVFGAVLVGFAVLEFSTALRSAAGRHVPRVVSVVAAIGVLPVAFFLHLPGLWMGLVGALALVTLWRLIEHLVPSRRRSGADLARDLAAGALVQIYVTFMAGFYLVLTGNPGGEWWTLAAMITVVGVDTAAYITGLNLGKHKMAPTISPGKTWEGFAGAVVFALIAGTLLALFMLGQPWWVGLILGGALLLSGTMGDLAESLIKRDLGVKDISGWLPGHGGFFDRLDSILPSGVVVFVIALIFAPGVAG